MNNKTAAIVVTYNRKEMLSKNIEALMAQTYRDVLDVIVIDNASTDGTKESIEKYVNNGEVKYYNTGSNLGGAGGFNYGIKQATEMGYNSVWVLDDDTIPKQTALEELIEQGKKLDDNYGFLSSKVLWKDGSICTMNVQKETKWRRVKKYDAIKRIQYASFVSLFIRTEIIRKVGLPFKEFFIWADDWEYTRRISKKYPCFLVSSSVVEHWCESNTGADIITASDDRLGRFTYMYRNDVVLYRQDGIEGKIYLWLRNNVHKLRIVLKATNKREKLRTIKKGTKEGEKFFPKVEFPIKGY